MFLSINVMCLGPIAAMASFKLTNFPRNQRILQNFFMRKKEREKEREKERKKERKKGKKER
jgi:hypothetical protein